MAYWAGFVLPYCSQYETDGSIGLGISGWRLHRLLLSKDNLLSREGYRHSERIEDMVDWLAGWLLAKKQIVFGFEHGTRNPAQRNPLTFPTVTGRACAGSMVCPR